MLAMMKMLLQAVSKEGNEDHGGAVCGKDLVVNHGIIGRNKDGGKNRN